MTEEFDKGFWEDHWRARDRAQAPVAPPNPHLLREVAGLAPGTALEAGCGEGAEAIWLASRGWQVTAADISPRALARAGERAAASGVGHRVQWVEADLATWQPPSPYDLVTTHYAHPAMPQLDFYERVARWVAPGGTLLVVGHLHREGAAGDGGHRHQDHAPADHSHAEHAHGSAGVQPPAEASATAASITARLDAATWEVRTAEEPTRSTGGDDGSGALLHDVVVRAVRRPRHES